jgi:hypothetical protein
MAFSMGRVNATRAGAAAFTAFAPLLLLLLSPVAGQLMGNFGLSYGTAVWVVSLVAAGSIILFWVFPWLIPFLGTMRLIYFGAGFLIGW